MFFWMWLYYSKILPIIIVQHSLFNFCHFMHWFYSLIFINPISFCLISHEIIMQTYDCFRPNQALQCSPQVCTAMCQCGPICKFKLSLCTPCGRAVQFCSVWLADQLIGNRSVKSLFYSKRWLFNLPLQSCCLFFFPRNPCGLHCLSQIKLSTLKWKRELTPELVWMGPTLQGGQCFCFMISCEFSFCPNNSEKYFPTYTYDSNNNNKSVKYNNTTNEGLKKDYKVEQYLLCTMSKQIEYFIFHKNCCRTDAFYHLL